MNIVMHGECIETMRDMIPDNTIDAIVTDPPYGLGFMGKAWDDLPPGEEWARECLRVLKPGGHLLAFGGTRTWHRLAVAVEDAGFEIRDSIAWMYGTGFPKSRNVGNGWGTALKPAFEPIVMGRKPLTGTVAANVLAHGTGALNIDASRLGDGEGVVTFDRAKRGNAGDVYDLGTVTGVKPSGHGRWPANVALDEHTAGILDQQSGNLKSGKLMPHHVDKGKTAGILGAMSGGTGRESYGDNGGASRFFYVAKAPANERPKVNGIAHPTVKPLTLMRWLIRLVTPPGGTVLDPFAGSGTTLEAAALEGFPSIGIEREADYLPLIRARLDRVNA